MYIYLSDSSGNGAGCCYVPDAAWPSVRATMNSAARAAGMSFVAQTDPNSSSDVTATCTTPAAAQAWVQGAGGQFGYERSYFSCIKQPGRVQGLDCESRCEFGSEVNSNASRFGDDCAPIGTLGNYAIWDQIQPYNLTPLHHRLCGVRFAGEDVSPDAAGWGNAYASVMPPEVSPPSGVLFGCETCPPGLNAGVEFGPAGDVSKFGHAGHHGGHQGGGGYGGALLIAEEIPDYSWIDEMRYGGVVSRG